MFHFVKEEKHQPGNAQGTLTPLVCAHAGRTQAMKPTLTKPA